MSDNIGQRLEALYTELADVRLAQDNAWTQGRTKRTQEAYDNFMSEIRALERDEDDLIEQIEALGGEDPDL